MLFGGYRRGDANDPDGYVASIAAVLSLYDPELVRRATDPRTGISTTEKFQTFMPNSGELKAYCDQQAAIADRLKQYAELPRPAFKQLPPPPKSLQPGHRANVIVPDHTPQYPAMLLKAQDPTADPLEFKWVDGVLWVSWLWLHPKDGRGTA